MTEARLIKVKSALSGQLQRPGGRSLAEAERLADAALLTHRATTVADLGDLISRLEDLCAAASADGQGTVYDLACRVVDLAGFFDTGAFFEVAYSLCDLTDRCRAAGVWRWRAVGVHVSALRLLHSRDFEGGRDAAAILAGLKQVAAAVLADGPSQPTG